MQPIWTWLSKEYILCLKTNADGQHSFLLPRHAMTRFAQPSFVYWHVSIAFLFILDHTRKKHNQKIAWVVTAWNRKRTAIYVTKLIDVICFAKVKSNPDVVGIQIVYATQCVFSFSLKLHCRSWCAHLFWCCKIAIIAHVKMHWGEKFNFNRILLSKHTCGDK